MVNTDEMKWGSMAFCYHVLNGRQMSKFLVLSVILFDTAKYFKCFYGTINLYNNQPEICNWDAFGSYQIFCDEMVIKIF